METAGKGTTMDHVFVARETELLRLAAMLDRSLTDKAGICLVSGEAGSGKTTLVNEFTHRAQQANHDLLIALGSCNAQTGAGDPYLPFRQALGMLAGDVDDKLVQTATSQENAGRLRSFLRFSGQALVEIGPDLIGLFVPGAGLAARVGTFAAEKGGWFDRLNALVERPVPVPGEMEQGHIFEQYTNVLQTISIKQPLIMVLDDLHWADAASINLLFHLGRSLGHARVLLIGLYRPEEVALGRDGARHPLVKVLAEFKRYFGDVEINLDQAQQTHGRHFVDALLGAMSNRFGEAFYQALFDHTNGHPLFTIELLEDLKERGAIFQDQAQRWAARGDLDWETLPARIEGVIEERIGRLEDDLRDILSVASVEGQEFTAQVVARIQDVRERHLVRRLSQELQRRHRLVEEQGETEIDGRRVSHFQFAHTLFQHYLYSELGASERRLLHGEIAAALEDLYHGRTGQITVQLARHYLEADERDRAAEYLLLAGDRARRLYAYEEAVGLYRQALVFLQEGQAYSQAARTLVKLGLTHHLVFDFESARLAFDKGFALWQRASKPEPATIVPPAPHALRVDWPYPPLTLDPTLARDVDSTGVIDQLFSGLVTLGSEMDILPEMATSWEVLDEGRNYVFHLREDALWSDGAPVTAGDFQFAWMRVLDPAVNSPNAGLLYGIKGAKAYHQGAMADPGEVGIRAPGRTTLAVEMERPIGFFPQLLAYNACFPVPSHIVRACGERWTDLANLVTNGPFKLDAWDQGRVMILSRHTGYPGRSGGNVEQVELSLDADWASRLAAYEADSLDTLSLWDLSKERDRARQWHSGEYLSSPGLSTLSVAFNTRQAPFNDPKVRWAFVQAVDRETLANTILHGYEFPATGGFLPPGVPGHSAGIGLPFDLDLARQLLKEAGYPAAQGLPPVTLLGDKGRESLCRFLADQWHQNLGADVAWETIEWTEFMHRLKEGPPHLFLFAWGADYPDPDNFMGVCDEIGRTGWQNETYDQLLSEARQTTDQAARIKMYAHADRLLIGQAAIMPFTYGRLHMLIKPWIAKYPTSGIKWWYWKDVVIEPH